MIAKTYWTAAQAEKDAAEAGYEDVRDWAADTGCYRCATCEGWTSEPAGFAGDSDDALCRNCLARGGW